MSLCQGGMPRQITKNPLNMLGGMGTDRTGGYSSGSAGASYGGGGGSKEVHLERLQCRLSSGGGGAGFGGGERGGGSSFSERPGVGKIGEMPKQQQGSNGSGYTTDGYGMGAMGSR